MIFFKKKPSKEIPEQAENQFEYDGKKYRVLLGKMNIGELGTLTAADVCASIEAQEYLVKCNCLGSVLEEVIE